MSSRKPPPGADEAKRSAAPRGPTDPGADEAKRSAAPRGPAAPGLAAADAAEPALRPLDALKIELDELEEGAQELAVELPQPWVAEILAETDAIAQSGGAARLELTLHADRTLLVRGRIELRYAVPCARCLAPATVDVGAETEELCVTFVPADRLRSWAEVPGTEGDDDDIEPLEPSELDELGYHGSTVDLRGLISEQILLAYPMRILCDRGEACLGLCMRCGADLNKLIPEGSPAPERCPSCNVRLDGADDEGADTPWKQALSKLPPQN
ncbi:MAG: DUF177 domain-containing protein [Enhygromyxa sp.]